METVQSVLFEEVAGKTGAVGLVTLNRPDALNSLSFDMIKRLYAQLQVWAKVPTVKAVIIRAVPGRAFCAGGDLRLTYERMQGADQHAMDFFQEEYELNSYIFHYPKPYIALLDGITMGGGVGISIHGSHRVATEKLLFAMPETGIGFFPDVGGTYFLPRLQGKLGYYLGLTGKRLHVEDCVALGIAQYQVASDQLTEVVQAIVDMPLTQDAKETVSEMLRRFHVSSAKPSTLLAEKEEIHYCFSKKTVEEILAALKMKTTTHCQEAYEAILKKSPISLKVSLRALQLGESLDFDACMKQEHGLSRHFLNGHDFKEGIRAVIIDKDQAPHWEPDTLGLVSDELVKSYFN